MVLTPAACYPLYPAMAARGPLPEGGVTLDTGDSYVFRREPSSDPSRMQIFHMREIVRVADRDTVVEWRLGWRARAEELLRSLGLELELDIASDPFFGRTGRLLAAQQRDQELKWELLAPVAGDKPTAIASSNYHQDHFGHTYGLPHQRRGARPHRMHGVRRGAGDAGAVRRPWPGPARLARRGARDPGALAVSATSSRSVSLWGIDPAGYEAHALHAPGRTYLETNCYADVLIELLHARGDEPLAMLGFIVATEWEGDQFTYAKPRYADLDRLFGIDIHEMLPYRSLPEHIEEQLALGRTVLVEMDAWYLPDTAATSYRREHLKTTVAPEMIDRDGERMRYFHNAGFFELDGEDYRGAFRSAPAFHRRRHGSVHRDRSLRRRAATHRRGAAAGRPGPARRPLVTPPAAQPVRGLGRAARRPTSLGCWPATPRTTTRTRSSPCAWSDPPFELLADHIDWLFGGRPGPTASARLREIVEGTKIVSFRLARRRPFDPEPRWPRWLRPGTLPWSGSQACSADGADRGLGGRLHAPGPACGARRSDAAVLDAPRASRAPPPAAVGADGRDFDAEDWWFRCRFDGRARLARARHGDRARRDRDRRRGAPQRRARARVRLDVGVA